MKRFQGTAKNGNLAVDQLSHQPQYRKLVMKGDVEPEKNQQIDRYQHNGKLPDRRPGIKIGKKPCHDRQYKGCRMNNKKRIGQTPDHHPVNPGKGQIVSVEKLKAFYKSSRSLTCINQCLIQWVRLRHRPMKKGIL